MKKFFLLLGLMALTTTGAMAQTNLSVGTGDGSLSVDVYDTGFLRDTATFDPVGADTAAGTIWNLCWWVYDVDGDVQHWSDLYPTGFSQHSNQITAGTVNTTPTSLTDTGMTFTGSPDLTADVDITLVPNSNSPLMTWEWTFYNAGASAMDIRVVWFVDVDNLLTTDDYQDDNVGLTPSSNFAGNILAVGNSDGSGGIDMNTALLMDSNTAIERFVGLSDNFGASDYWGNTANYQDLGVEAVYQIDDSLADDVENDADNDGVTDTGQDCGAAYQWNLTIPASGNVSVEAYLTWGPGGTFSSVDEWSAY